MKITQEITALNLITLDATDKTPLYLHYNGQTNEQGAYLQISQNGDITADVNAEIGNGIPESVWSRRVKRITIPNTLTHVGIKELVEDHEDDLLALVNGMGEDWDGSNWRGTTTEEGDAALNRLATALMEWDVADSYEHFTIESAGDCAETDLLGDDFINAETTDDELSLIADRIILGWGANSADGVFVFIPDLKNCLEEIRDNDKWG